MNIYRSSRRKEALTFEAPNATEAGTNEPRYLGCYRVGALLAIFVAVLTAAAPAAEPLIATNSVWRYQKGTKDASAPADAWRALEFDDSIWATGPAPFHYGENVPGGTVLGDMRNRYSSVFLRRRFAVGDPAEIGGLDLTAICDDGFIAWINGIEVARYNMPSGAVPYNGFASMAVAEPVQFRDYPIAGAGTILRAGMNILALQVWNTSLTSSDLRLDLELRALIRETVPPVILEVRPPAGTVFGLTEVTVVFSEPVASIEAGDLLINNQPATAVDGFGAAYRFTFAQPPYGAVEVTWDPGHGISDLASPPNPFDERGPAAGWQYFLADQTPPAVTLIVPPPDGTVRSLTQLEVTFNEPIAGVEATDLLINGQPAAGVVGSLAGPYLFNFDQPPAGSVAVAWNQTHGITDLAAPPNPFAGGAWSYRVDTNAPLAQVRINEFLAANISGTGLKDEDGELEDWIEIFNLGTNRVELRGWSLTDSEEAPDRWVFPEVSLEPGQYLIVFASGKDRHPAAPGARLHANFKLNPAGEFLALWNAESPRQVVSQFQPGYPEQRNDYAYGWDAGFGAYRYFRTPTPGGPNASSSIGGPVPPVEFSVGRGFYDAPVTLGLATATAGASVRYTIDGSEPTETQGTLYTAPLEIHRTTIVRAAAFASGRLPSSVGSHSYIFLEDILAQPAAPPDLPRVWIDNSGRNWTADYEMDPEITQDPRYRDRLRAALQSLPALSLVTRPDDMFDNTRGIYPKSQARGPSWERPASLELLYPDGRKGFQVDCGAQMQGNSVRDPQKTGKHAFRIVFKGDYGPAKLRHRFFPDSPVTEFDTITLRADFNNSWMHWNPQQRPRGQRIRDAFMKDSQRAMSGFSAHNRFVHLYVNGLYWGVYDPTERPDGAFGAAYLGGEKEEYDVMNEGALVDGNRVAYDQMLAINNLANDAAYAQMQQYLDVPHYIDYILLHFYAGHEDWGNNKNWYTLRRRAPGQGYKYICWDGELILNSTGVNRVSNADTASGLHTKLRANAEYRMLFGDRVHRHLFNGGALTPAAAASRWVKRAAEVEMAMVAESARWGDYRRDVHQYQTGPYQLYTRDGHWATEQNRLLTNYFPARTSTVLSQLRAAGLYPNVTAPAFNQHGGYAPPGFQLEISAPAGTIYYTTNGSDPRIPRSGAVAPGAQAVSGPITLNATVQMKARALVNGTWSALNEAEFQVGERGFPVRIAEIHYHPAGSETYEFIELENFGRLAIDLGGLRVEGADFLFPLGSRLEAGARIVLASGLNPAGFAARYPGVPVAGYFDGNLSNGGERLALVDPEGRILHSVDYDDNNGWPRAADGFGPSLELVDPNGDPDDPSAWQASALAGGSPGGANTTPPPPRVRLNELMADNRAAVPLEGEFPDWIELFNAGSEPMAIDGWSLSDNPDQPRKFVFPAGALIAAGGYLVVWCDGQTNQPGGLHAAFSIAREGESVFLYDPEMHRIDSVRFGLQAPDYSMGLDSAGQWILTRPTPGGPNQPAALGSITNLVINEWLANSRPGEDDWIELFNRSALEPVSLHRVYLESANGLFRIQARSFLGPGEFLRLWADEQAGTAHLDWKLSAAGGFVALYDAEGRPVDRIQFGLQSEQYSEGRIPDGAGTIMTSLLPTPGAPNVVDQDGDQISDLWETAYGLDPGDPLDAAADPDRDGMTNLEEYLGGTDPHDPASRLHVAVTLAPNGRVHLQFNAISGRSYSIQSRDQINEGPWTTRQRISTVAATGAREFEDDFRAPAGQRFYRVITPAD